MISFDKNDEGVIANGRLNYCLAIKTVIHAFACFVITTAKYFNEVL